MNRNLRSPHPKLHDGRARGKHLRIQALPGAWNFEWEQSTHPLPSIPHLGIDQGNEPIHGIGYHHVFPRSPIPVPGPLGGIKRVLTALTWQGPHVWCINERQSEPSRARMREKELLPETFGRLTQQWREDTAGFSSPTRMTSNQAYLSVIALGQSVVPLILEELRDHGGFWYPALKAITGENPVPTSAIGSPRLMKDAWLKWGQQFELID